MGISSILCTLQTGPSLSVVHAEVGSVKYMYIHLVLMFQAFTLNEAQMISLFASQEKLTPLQDYE